MTIDPTKPGPGLKLNVSIRGNYLGLVGWWTFDGKNMIQNVVDSSSSGNTGYLAHGGSGTTTVPGKVGQALQFDGSDDVISIGKVVISSYPQSVCAWAKINNVGSLYNYLFYQAEAQLYIRNVSGTIIFAYYNSSNQISYTIPSFIFGKWAHYCATVDASRNANLYINGSKVAGPTTLNSVSLTHNAYLGSNGSTITNGSIDDIRAYNRELSATEVLQLYNMGR